MKKLLIILILCSGCMVTPKYRQFQTIEGTGTIITDGYTGRQRGLLQETHYPYRKWYIVEMKEIIKYKEKKQ